MGKKYIILLVFSLLIGQSFAVGVKEIDPLNDRIALAFSEVTSFMGFDKTPDERLYVEMRQGEKLYYGFHFLIDDFPKSSGVYTRIKDKAGNIVMSSKEVSMGGEGHIANRSQAESGPNSLAATGYKPILFEAPYDGSFYIEINEGSPTESRYPSGLFTADWYDFTVTSATNEVKNGRVWSTAWQLRGLDGISDAFNAKQYIYTDDGITSVVDYNGMNPIHFVVISNAHGTGQPSDPQQTKKSLADIPYSYALDYFSPQYKLFFDEPDPEFFPDADLDEVFGQLLEPITISGCPGDFCFNINVDRESSVTIDIEQNGVPGFQENTEDVQLVGYLSPGNNCLPWDGLDGAGKAAITVDLEIQIDFLSGVTHLPMYDVEECPNGITVEFVRPAAIAGPAEVYWDDELVEGNQSLVNGCKSGCHAFPSPGTQWGNEKMINSWWYINKPATTQKLTIDFPVFAAGPDKVTCVGQEAGLESSPGYSAYYWSPSFTLSDAAVNNPQASPEMKTAYIVKATDADGCNFYDTVVVDVLPLPMPEFEQVMDGCLGEQMVLNLKQPHHSVNFSVTGALGTSSAETLGLTLNQVGDVSILLEETSGDGCVGTNSYVLKSHSLPNPMILGEGMCKEEEKVYTVDQPEVLSSYVWSVTGATSFSSQNEQVSLLSNTADIELVVQEKDMNGCVNWDTSLVTIEPTPYPVVQNHGDSAFCEGEYTYLSYTGTNLFGTQHWYRNGQIFSVGDSALVKASGEYVLLANNNGCRNADTSMVSVHEVDLTPYPDVILDYAKTDYVTIGANLEINVDDYELVWGEYLPAELEHEVSPEEDTRYQVSVTTDIGCQDTASVFVKVFHPIIVPNGITPNGDDLNETWEIKNIDLYSNRVRIYNRWGTVVWQGYNYENSWHGLDMDGKVLPTATYYYVIELFDVDREFSGAVVIMR